MIRKIFVCLMTTGLALASQAQKINAGLKGGLNLSNFYGTTFEDAKKQVLVGYHVGGFVTFSLAGLSIQPELLLSSAGAKVKSSISNEMESIKLTYITVPVMVRLKMAKGLFAELGPQVGFKISEDFGNQTIENFAKGLDLSGAVGLGYQMDNGFGVGVRYLQGISKVGDFDPNTGFDNNFKNGVIQVGVFYRLTKGK